MPDLPGGNLGGEIWQMVRCTDGGTDCAVQGMS